MISTTEWMKISQDLEQHHALFYQCWQMGRPILTEEIETAGVKFNKEGIFIEFMFNPIFWEAITDYEKTFVISHECLHIILNHGCRSINSKDITRTNIALDIVVNHMLVNGFGFDRYKLSMQDSMCWVDTIFAEEEWLNNITLDQTFEYYYQLISKNPSDNFILDDHSGLGNSSELLKKLNEILSPEEKLGIKHILDKHSGTEESSKWTFARVDEVQKKKKWETVIKKWAKKYLKTAQNESEHWLRINRRWNNLDDKLIIPSEMENDIVDRNKLPVFFFLDTSGSCWGLRDRFFTAALSLPSDLFKIKLFCFDTSVQQTTLESKRIYGGGGTNFQIIENAIQEVTQEQYLDYPEAVFIITDGYGSKVTPKTPQNWHWFLTKHNTKIYIPKESKTYLLNDYD